MAKDSSYTTFNNIVASIVLAICVLGIVVSLVYGVCRSQKEDSIPQNITILVKQNSRNNSAEGQKALVDSINLIINRHEQILTNRYQALIEERENEQRLLSHGGLLIGIIISILGFFGFKSFRSLEDKANDIAESKANAVAKFATQSYLDENIDTEIEKVIRKKFNNSIKESLRDELNLTFSDKFNKLDSIESRLVLLESEFDQLSHEVHAIQTDRENRNNQETQETSTGQEDRGQDSESSDTDSEPLNPFDV